MNEIELRDVDFGTYTEEQYFDDMGRLTQYRCDPDMTEILIRSSFEAGVWMRGKGVRFQPGSRCSTKPRRSASCRATLASKACGCATKAASGTCAPRR
jgi:succinate dehydrogenase/fumarate reductase flavoprotein subunit